MPACLVVLLVSGAFLGCSEVARGSEDKEFSLEEFYDIKRSVSRSKLMKLKASAALEQAREIGTKLHSSLPKAPSFYGQDHYEQSFNENGQETWTHVGRPVGILLAINHSFNLVIFPWKQSAERKS